MTNSSLSPRNGHKLVVGIVARISGCANQKELSLEDQIDHAKEIVAEFYDGKVEFRPIATKGKGERLDRPELQQVEASLSRDLIVDVFNPPQRECIRSVAVRLRREGYRQYEIAKLLPEKPMPQTVSKALALHDLMEEMGLQSPYVPVRSPPEDYRKLRRHRNKKYRFKPLQGYEPPEI